MSGLPLLRVELGPENRDAEKLLPAAVDDGSGVGINYADAYIKGIKVTLEDGRKVTIKRRGLKLTFTIGDRMGDGLLRRLQNGPDEKNMLREALGWDDKKLILTFQSRFGRAEWLQPYTDETIERLAREGVKRLAVVTPGFIADCVETLEEIAMENRDIFKAAGGEACHYIPALNARADHVAALRELVTGSPAAAVQHTPPGTSACSG